ncbi:MAG: FxsA family protein [Deltaproteobacteria bacterium]|nr:FxsA family protein [Deltaproteobacteria bacterium]
MLWLLVIPLLVLPWLEGWLFIRIHLPFVLAVVWSLASAYIGWRFARREDLALWNDVDSAIRNGRLPTREAVEGLMVLAGGWLLIVPGLITDILGALLLFPQTREELAEPIRAMIKPFLKR